MRSRGDGTGSGGGSGGRGGGRAPVSGRVLFRLSDGDADDDGGAGGGFEIDTSGYSLLKVVVSTSSSGVNEQPWAQASASHISLQPIRRIQSPPREAKELTSPLRPQSVMYGTTTRFVLASTCALALACIVAVGSTCTIGGLAG